MNFNVLKNSQLSANYVKDQMNATKKSSLTQKTQVVLEPFRGRNSRQFGTDITNVNYQNQKLDLKQLHNEVNHKKTNTSSNILNNEVSVFKDTDMLIDSPIEVITQSSSPQIVMEYIDSISDEMFYNETMAYYPNSNYMFDMQSDINEKMRVILFDWLVDVHYKWKLLPETLFLTFNLVDRYLSRQSVDRSELQCVGVAALLIACKYEEIYFPDLADFKEITDNSFSKKAILQMENNILIDLKYDITMTSSLKFFEYYNIYMDLSQKHLNCAYFLLDLCAFNYQMLKYKPSQIAASIMLLIVNSRKYLNEKLFKLCRSELSVISNICKEIMNLYQKSDNGSKSLKRKYSSSRYNEVATMNIMEYFTKGN